MTKPSVCTLRTDVSGPIGSGHFVRCLSLAETMGDHGFEPVFVLGQCTDSAMQALTERGIGAHVLPERLAWGGESRWFADSFSGAAMVMDISHHETHARLDGFTEYIADLRETMAVCAVIDGLGLDAVSDKVKVPSDILIQPYFGAKENLGCGAKTFLCGPRYMIFSSDYARAHQFVRRMPDPADRVFMTFGGGDPAGMTLLGLDALARIMRRLEVRVAVGPDFSSDLKQAIMKTVSRLNHDLELLDSPTSLLEHMLWCDVAVSASGLTKYELALTGTPSIFLSPNPVLADINKSFARAGTGIDMGLCEDVLPDALACELVALLDDAGRRVEFAEKGRALVDHRGAGRIMEHLRRTIHA